MFGRRVAEAVTYSSNSLPSPGFSCAPVLLGMGLTQLLHRNLYP